MSEIEGVDSYVLFGLVLMCALAFLWDWKLRKALFRMIGRKLGDTP